MICFEFSTESVEPIAVIVIGEHLKILKNPKLTAYMPFWLQEDLTNSALRRAGRPSPKVACQVARIIEIGTLRKIREERAAEKSHIGRQQVCDTDDHAVRKDDHAPRREGDTR